MNYFSNTEYVAKNKLETRVLSISVSKKVANSREVVRSKDVVKFKWEIAAFLRKDVTTLKSRYNKHTA